MAQGTDKAQSEGNMESDCDDRVRAKRIRGRAFTFTWFGATEQRINKFINICETKEYKYILGDEICPDTGRQHYQGYINFNGGQMQKNTFEKMIDNGWSKISKGNPWKNWNYCNKDAKIRTNIEREAIEPDVETEERRLELRAIYSRSEIDEWRGWMECEYTVNTQTLYFTDLEIRAEKAKYLSLKTGAMIVPNDEKLVINRITAMYKKHDKHHKHDMKKWKIPNLIVMMNDKNSNWLDSIGQGIVMGAGETIIGSPCKIIKMYLLQNTQSESTWSLESNDASMRRRRR